MQNFQNDGCKKSNSKLECYHSNSIIMRDAIKCKLTETIWWPEQKW